jgi:Meckel syndrome type 1 protein
MATDPDPYRTLGLAPGASADDIRRAYRRLAKANHPDSAGEAALPRFLAIQAAYESLLGPARPRRSGARAGTSRPAPQREPWRADPERARQARRRAGAAGTTGSGDGAGATGAAGTTGSWARSRSAAGDDPRRPGGRKRASNKATLGSTTYDAAEDEPFDPEWSGGTWYGASSGTYWTINPKEYADPRKHGPEYQRRARRPAGGPSTGRVDEGCDDGVDEGGGKADGPVTDGRPGAWTTGPAADEPVAATGSLLEFRSGFPFRVGLALVGWPPLGVALSTVAGEVTGCGRFSASCVELFGVGTWLAQLAIIAILLALPSVAVLSAVGTVAALAAAVPTAVILSAAGGSREPAASASVLGAVLALAYLAGVVFATVRRPRIRGLP